MSGNRSACRTRPNRRGVSSGSTPCPGRHSSPPRASPTQGCTWPPLPCQPRKSSAITGPSPGPGPAAEEGTKQRERGTSRGHGTEAGNSDTSTPVSSTVLSSDPAGAASSCPPPRIAGTSSEQPTQTLALWAALPVTWTPAQATAPPTRHGPAFQTLVTHPSKGSPCRARTGDRASWKQRAGLELERKRRMTPKGRAFPRAPSHPSYYFMILKTGIVS